VGHGVDELLGFQPFRVLVDLEGEGLERVGTDRVTAARRVACERQVEAEEPDIHHRAHRIEAIEWRAFLGYLVPHVDQNACDIGDRGSHLCISRKPHERVGRPADAQSLRSASRQ
jgi:hypothetical protein